MQITEESGVRDLVLGDWAWTCIMDGHWFSPADIWYDNALPGKPMAVHTVHPCPWSCYSTSSASSSPTADDEDDNEHPRQSTIMAEIPPTFDLCQQAFIAHQKAMHEVLIHPMRNIVCRLGIECSTPCLSGGKVEDPAIRAARMSMEDLLTDLREEEGGWFEGFDWAEHRRNDRHARQKREQENGYGNTSDDSSTSSSGSRSSNDTSPVLSTTTLQTTPSPPPMFAAEDNDTKVNKEAGQQQSPIARLTKPVTIAIAPVLHPPRLLRAIPYIPVTISHMPQYSLDAFKVVSHIFHLFIASQT